jgi:putative IMPACT (imprinted ancient) family translation regulator
MQRITIAGACAVLFAAAGCGGSALPPAKVTDAQSAISAAQAVGANNNPQAALHLKLAHDQLQEAEKLIKDDQEEKARLLLDRARVDAELALTLTKREQQLLQSQKAQQQVQELQ